MDVNVHLILWLHSFNVDDPTEGCTSKAVMNNYFEDNLRTLRRQKWHQSMYQLENRNMPFPNVQMSPHISFDITIESRWSLHSKKEDAHRKCTRRYGMIEVLIFEKCTIDYVACITYEQRSDLCRDCNHDRLVTWIYPKPKLWKLGVARTHENYTNINCDCMKRQSKFHSIDHFREKCMSSTLRSP